MAQVWRWFAVCGLTVWLGGAVYAATIGYTYDSLGRVTGATYPKCVNVAYNYDDAGNRTKVSGELPPTANVDDNVTTTAGAPKTIDPRGNDTDPDRDMLTVTAVTAPASGVATFTASTVTYTPNSGFTGSDTFKYTISDGRGCTDKANVNVTVN